jgi:hypothetical protein
LYRSGAVRVGSAVSAVNSAISAGQGIMASGSWELRQRNGAWEVIAIQHRGLVASRRVTVPTLGGVTASDEGITGTLVNGTSYDYAVAMMDNLGNYGVASADVTAAADSTGCLRLSGNVVTSPARLVVWRKAASTGVLTAPDAYVILPWDGYNYRLYDTGVNINKWPWITTSVPVPNTVAFGDHSTSAIGLDAGNVWPLVSAIKSSGTVRNNTASLTNDPDLAVALEPNAKYQVDMLLIYDASAAGQFQIEFTVPSGTALSGSMMALAGSITAATSGIIETAVLSNTVARTLGVAGVGTQVTAHFIGFLQTSNTSGNLTLQWAQAVADPTNATLRSKSALVARRVG